MDRMRYERGVLVWDLAFFSCGPGGDPEGGSGIRGMKNLREGFASAPARLFGRGIGRMGEQLVSGGIIWSEYYEIKVYSI